MIIHNVRAISAVRALSDSRWGVYRCFITKRALDSDIRRHYTGHDTFKFMAGVETLREVHEVCRLQVNPSFTFTWGTDC